jgi:hypothetical protein
MVRLRMVGVSLVTCAALGLGAVSAGAFSNPGSNGNAANAPGQATAKANCSAAFDRQDANGVSAGGGPKAGEPGPLNCDHFFGAPGKP